MSLGKTLEFLPRPTRDAEAAQRFFGLALHISACSAPQGSRVEVQVAQPTALAAPRVINVDKNAASPKAIADLKVSGILPETVELRQVKYRGNLIEQDHRAHQTLEASLEWDSLPSRQLAKPYKGMRR